jgi:hypothetical protein
MATPRKVEWFLQETQALANYRMVTGGVLQQLSIEMLSRGEREMAELASLQIKVNERLEGKVVDLLGKLYGKLFTDDDLEQLVAIYKQKVSEKLRESIPIIQVEMMNFLGAIDFEKLAEEIMAESGT